MIVINDSVSLPEDEVTLSAVRAQGAGGQHVNKVSSAIDLQFDSQGSSLPQHYKEALLQYRDRRISSDGTVRIKAQRHRSQQRNREEALERLAELIRNAWRPQKQRHATKPSRRARQRRMDGKTRRGQIKKLRGAPIDS